jgi:hypothetical protein
MSESLKIDSIHSMLRIKQYTIYYFYILYNIITIRMAAEIKPDKPKYIKKYNLL